jgi:hypothetical protein
MNMTDQLRLQPDLSVLVEESSIELNYPQISLPSPLATLLHHSASTTMANRSEPDNPDPALSESWTNLSDADYSLDDDLRSETTDAASLLDHTGPDDVHSIDERTSDTGSEGAHSDRSMSQDLSPHESLIDSAKTLRTESVSALQESRLGHPISLRPAANSDKTEFEEVTQILEVFNDKDADEIAGCVPSGEDCCRIVGRVCMTISKNNLDVAAPFRLLYIGDKWARAEILAKIGDLLMAGPEPRQNRHKMDASRYHVVPSSCNSDSPSNHPDLVPIKTQIIVDDCFTAASIKNEGEDDHIFLSFKNGSLYSSRWNGTIHEVSSPSPWTPPDLAIFFLAHDDPAELRQRHQIAHDFVSRHQIPWLIISETRWWTESFTDRSIDHMSPHFRIAAEFEQDQAEASELRRLPIDLETFGRLEPGQLNKNFACLYNHARTRKITNACSHSSTSSSGKKASETGKAVCRDSSESNIWGSFFGDSPLRRIILMAAAGLMSLFIGLVACRISVTLLMHFLSSAGDISELSPATTWSHQPSPVATISDKTAAIIQTASSAVASGSNTASKGLATIYTPSELAEMITSKSLQSTNKSENFQVHSIGDCHIVVKTPRGFKVRSKSVPFDVVVARGVQVIDSSLSKLFDGVYTVHVNGEEAYGLLNVTIRRHKSSILEEHQVDFGAKWLMMAGWKKAAQIASEQIRNDLETAQGTLSAAYEQLSEDLQFKAKGVSKKAARQAKKISHHSRLFLESMTSLLKMETNRLRYATTSEQQDTYNALSKRAELAFQALVVYAHTTNQRGRDVLENILVSAGQTAEHLQQQSMRVDLADVQNKMQEYMRSERLAKAQERAKQIVRDTSSSWRERRALRRARRSGCGQKGTACNR